MKVKGGYNERNKEGSIEIRS